MKIFAVLSIFANGFGIAHASDIDFVPLPSWIKCQSELEAPKNDHQGSGRDMGLLNAFNQMLLKVDHAREAISSFKVVEKDGKKFLVAKLKVKKVRPRQAYLEKELNIEIFPASSTRETFSRATRLTELRGRGVTISEHFYEALIRESEKTNLTGLFILDVPNDADLAASIKSLQKIPGIRISPSAQRYELGILPVSGSPETILKATELLEKNNFNLRAIAGDQIGSPQ